MIITANDGRNLQIVGDQLHLKLLVELLRTLETEQLKKATNEVQLDGWDVTIGDAIAAMESFCSIVGFVVDPLIKKVDTKPNETETQQTQSGQEQPAENQPKVWVN